MKIGDKVTIREPDGTIREATICFVSGAYQAELDRKRMGDYRRCPKCGVHTTAAIHACTRRGA